MGIEINKSGLKREEIFEKFGSVPEAITTANNNFSCAEPTFEVGDDGRLFGGDMSAFERLKQLVQPTKEENEEVSFVANSNFAPAMEPTC